MELFLNILWLLVALGILGAWRVRWVSHGRKVQHSPLMQWAAIGSALVLLFFAISLSDDLHLDVALSSESSASRRHSIVGAPAHDSSHGGRVVTDAGGAVLPRIAPQGSLGQLIARLTPRPDASLAFIEYGQFSGRAPPAFFL